MKGVAAILLQVLLAAQEPGLRIEREVFLRTGTSHRLAWSSDGKWIASGGDRGEVLVLEATSGKVVHELEASDHWIRGLAFAPDASALAVVGRELSVWELPTGKLRARHPAAGATAVAWTPDGARLGCILDNDTAALLDARDLEVVQKLPIEDDSAADSVAFAPDGRRVAVGKRSGLTHVFACETGALVTKVEQEGWVQDLAWLADGRLLRLSWNGALHGFADAAVTIDKNAWGMAADARGRLCVIWNGERIRGLLPGGTAFTVAGSGPAAVGPDGTAWARASGHELEFFAGAKPVRTVPLPHRATPVAVVLTGDGRYLAMSGGSRTAQVFQAADGTPVDLRGTGLLGVPVPYRAGSELALWRSPALPGEEPRRGVLTLWSIDALRKGVPGRVRELEYPGEPRDLEASAPWIGYGGRWFAVNHRVHDLLNPGGEGWRVADGYDHRRVVPAADGRRALVLAAVSRHRGGGGTGSLGWFGADGQWQQRIDIDELPWAAAPSPDGTTVALLTSSGLRLLDADTLAERRLCPGSWHALEWIDAGRLLLLEHDRGVVMLSTTSPEQKVRLELSQTARAMAIDLRGERAAVALQDRVLLLRIGK